MFMADEPDKKSASHFLIVLLDCFDKWGTKYNTLTDKKQPSCFVQSMKELQKIGIVFPK